LPSAQDDRKNQDDGKTIKKTGKNQDNRKIRIRGKNPNERKKLS